MNQVAIKLSHIRSVRITAIPSQTITGEEFRNANICWLQTADGGSYDILFDRYGNPLTDPDLVKRVGEFYGIEFKPILFDNRHAFAQIK